MTASPSRDADEMLILRMMDQDQDALVELLELYGEVVKGYLLKRYADTLSDIEIDVAINEAAFRVWNHAASFDLKRAPLRGWFITIAKREAIRIIDRGVQYVPFDEGTHGVTMDECGDEETEQDRKTKRQIKYFEHILENKLVGLQQNIIREDIKSSGKADNARLALKYGKSENNIIVSRNKAMANLRKHMTELEQNPPSPGELS